MKKLIITALFFSVSAVMYSQGNNWKLNGNNASSNDYVGTNNNIPLILKSNNVEGMRIDPTGNIGIGTTVTPEKLTVNGNILANGTISGTSLNVVDIVTSGKEFKINTSVCLKGIDVNDPLSRNEICGMGGNLFIQSEQNNNYHTIFNYGNNGSVGIGTTNPVEKFHVEGNTFLNGGLRINSLAGSASEFLIVDMNGNVVRGGNINAVAATAYSLPCLTDVNGNFLPTWHTGAFKLYTGGDVCENGIKVGINTTSPSSELHVVGNGFISQDLKVGTNSIVISGSNQIQGNTNKIYSFASDLYIQSDNTSNNTIFNVNNNGAVGIGTDCIPFGFRLAVEGAITSRKLVIESTNWCDYVFTKDYKLPALSEVENYITKNGHLEGVPSEKEVVENGIDIAEMNKILLKKVEELTLYSIQLEKENIELKKWMEELDKKVQEISNK